MVKRPLPAVGSLLSRELLYPLKEISFVHRTQIDRARKRPDGGSVATFQDVQRDAESAGEAAVRSLQRRFFSTETSADRPAPGHEGETKAFKACRDCLSEFAASSSRLVPAFLAADEHRAGPDSSGSVLPRHAYAGAFLDATGHSFVLFSTRLPFQSMIGLGPGLTLMALAQTIVRKDLGDAGSIFQRLCQTLSFDNNLPQWELVHGVVQGVGVYGFGLVTSGAIQSAC